MSTHRSWTKLCVAGSLALGLGASVTQAATTLYWDFEQSHFSLTPLYSDYPQWGTESDASGNGIDGAAVWDNQQPVVTPGAYAGSAQAWSLVDSNTTDTNGTNFIFRRIGEDPYSGNVDPKFAQLIPGKNSFTMEVFFKAPVSPRKNSDPNGYGYIADLVGSNSTESQIALEINTNGKITFRADAWSDDHLNDFTTTNAYDDNQWHHLAIVRDAAGQTIKYYVDYNPVASIVNDPNGTAPTPGDPNVTYDSGDFSAFSTLGGQWGAGLQLGSWFPNDKSHGADWISIDDFRISDTALTPGQFLGAVPEPTSIGLLLGGGALLAMRRRRA